MRKVLFLCVTTIFMVSSAWAQSSSVARDDSDRMLRSLGKSELGFNTIAAKKQKAENPNTIAACLTDVYVDDGGSDGNDGSTPALAKATIQAGIDAVCAGGTVHVYPGSYSETATGRFVLGSSGPYQFGLFIEQTSKDNITIQGVDNTGTPITDYSLVSAEVATNATNSFGYSGIFVEADGVTIQGLKILPNTAGDNKTFEIIGDAFTLQYCDITTGWSVYFNDWQFDAGTNTSHVQSYTVEENVFRIGGSVDLASGAGFSGPVSGRVIRNNTFEEDPSGQNWPFISFNGSDTGVPWFVYSVGGAIIEGNDFFNSYSVASPSAAHIRARGTYDNSQFDWESYWNNNTFNKATITLIGTYPPFDVRTYSYPNSYGTFNDVRRIGVTIQGEVDNAGTGDNVLVAAGTYAESNIHIDVAVTIIGAGTASTFVDGGGSGNIFFVDVDGVTVKDLTIQNGAFAVRFEKAGGTIDNTEFNNVQFKDNSTRGIEIHNATTVTDLRVIDCRFENNSIGIRMASTSTVDGLTITGSTFDTHSLAVYHANDGSSSTLRNLHIDNCTFLNSSDTAIFAEEIRDSIVENSTFTDNNRGITIFKAYTSAGVEIENVTIQGNEFNNCDNWPILLYQLSSGLAGEFKVLNNIVNQDVGVLTNNYGMIDIRLHPSFSHALVTISGNEVYFSGAFAGGAGATAAYAIKLRGGLSDIKIHGNTLDGGSVADGGGVPPLSGIYFQVSDGTFGTIPSISVVNITTNIIRDFVNGISVYDPDATAYGGLLTGTTVNVTECNQIFGNSSHGIRNDATTETINAPGNWWGASSGPTHASNPGGSGDVVSDEVIFNPFGIDANCNNIVLKQRFLFLAENHVKIDGNTGEIETEGDIHSNNKISFGEGQGDPAIHRGNLRAVGDISIDEDNLIKGDVFAGDDLFLFENAQVYGDYEEDEDVARIELPDPSFTAGGPRVIVPNNSTVSLTPGSYGMVRVNKGGTLELAEGIYYFKTLKLKRGATLEPLLGTAGVSINVVEWVKISKDVQFAIAESETKLFTLTSLQEHKLKVNKGSRVLGNLIFPHAEVYFDYGTSFKGGICAYNIMIEERVPFLHHSSTTALPKAIPSGDPDDADDADDEDELEAAAIPADYALEQNYPNPFNPSTKIAFALPEAGEVKLMIYDLKGNSLKTLARGHHNAGIHAVAWDGRNRAGELVANGTYIYRLTVERTNGEAAVVITKKMTFLK